jgi:hypothetical protein
MLVQIKIGFCCELMYSGKIKFLFNGSEDDWTVEKMILSPGQVIFIFAVMVIALGGCVFCGELISSFLQT